MWLLFKGTWTLKVDNILELQEASGDFWGLKCTEISRGSMWTISWLEVRWKARLRGSDLINI